jgi:chain length determinant protein tyrosine kinase EpsG
MERFRDSVLQPLDSLPDIDALSARPHGNDKALGDIIARRGKLSEERIERILAHQRQHGGRFGQSAIALGYATEEDVLHALSEQFRYPVATEEQRRLTPELVTLNEPFSRQAEVFRSIRSQLLISLFGQHVSPRRALAVLSPSPGDGKTYFAANLAVTMAQLGGRTLLVDADLRTPRLHEVFNVPNEAGLSGILSGRAQKRVVAQVPAVRRLYLLPVGVTPPNPLELVERPAFGLLMLEFTKKFDHVIMDTSAAEYGEDAAVIAAHCGAALVVARKHASRVDRLKELSETLKRCPDTMASVVLNEF